MSNVDRGYFDAEHMKPKSWKARKMDSGSDPTSTQGGI